jgi:hypothetical protein
VNKLRNAEKRATGNRRTTNICSSTKLYVVLMIIDSDASVEVLPEAGGSTLKGAACCEDGEGNWLKIGMLAAGIEEGNVSREIEEQDV